MREPAAWLYEAPNGELSLVPRQNSWGHPDYEGWTETPLYADEPRPNATDYRNRGERDAAYWRELCERMVYGDIWERHAASNAARAELARINAEALR